MRVSLCCVHDGVMVVALDESAQATVAGQTVKVHRGEALAGVSYERLRDLGDGEHELDPLAPPAELTRQTTVVCEAGPTLDGWTSVGFGVVCCVLAAVLFGVFTWMEFQGGSMRIHWLIALAYNLGGSWGAAGLCLLMGVVFILRGAGKAVGRMKDS